ncbi:MAG: type IX secretion system membrane protein PorP/SprF [Cytophagales bacterium]|nr:MAG: type IX secretion system membrane protein PorP/SprF [Cytophagales bacterium]
MKSLAYSLFIVTLLSLTATFSYAQETSLFTQYTQNKYFYNPAYAGYHGYAVGHLVYRKQWAGFDGAPETMLFSFQSPVAKTMGVGGRIFRDNTGVVSRTGAQVSYAYGVNIDDNQQLHFGISVGTLVNSVRWDILSSNDQQDQTLYRLNNSFVLDGAFGAFYRLKGLEVSFAFPQLFNRSLREQSTSSNSVFRYINQSVAAVSYRFDLMQGNLSLTPMLLHRFGAFAIQKTGQFDMSLTAEWQEKYWVSLMNRTDYGSAVNAGIHFKQFSFGYAYEFASSSSLIGNVSNGSHEILMSYHVGRKDKNKKKKEVEPQDNQLIAKADSTQTIKEEVAKLDTAGTKTATDSAALAKVEEKVEEKVEPVKSDAQVFDKPEAGKKYTVSGLFFTTGSAKIAEGSNTALDNLADFLQKNPTLKVEIGGHTDNVGNAATNQRLSENRAKAVVDYLASKGIDAKRLLFKGYGDKEPVATNDDEKDGRELNRRIEMKVLDNK